jgi:hypothetical protein
LTTVPRHHRDTTATASGGSYGRDNPHGCAKTAWLLDDCVSGPESAIYRTGYQQALGEIVKARTRYEAALAELDASRENLSSIVTLGEWVSSGGAHFAEAANDRLSGDGSLGFGQVLTALRGDLEHLTHFDSTDAEQPRRIAWERVSRAFQP